VPKMARLLSLFADASAGWHSLRDCVATGKLAPNRPNT